jgi:hypothetical protein
MLSNLIKILLLCGMCLLTSAFISRIGDLEGKRTKSQNIYQVYLWWIYIHAFVSLHILLNEMMSSYLEVHHTSYWLMGPYECLVPYIAKD